MRRWIALFVALALIPAGAAVAATKWKVKASETAEPEAEDAGGSAVMIEGELSVVDPVTGEVTYPYWMEKTDGSEALVFMMIDSVNDEAKLVEENGSLTIRMDFFDIDGEMSSTLYETLFDSEFGKGILICADGSEEEFYLFADRGAVLSEGRVTVTGPSYPPDEFETVWGKEGYYVGSEEELHAMATGTDGFVYMRTSDTYQGISGEFEYRLDGDMRLRWAKFYVPGEDGEFALKIIFTYSVGDPVELPDSVVQALREAA